MHKVSCGLAILFLLAAGCAWQADLDAVKRDLARHTEAQDKKTQATDARIAELQAQTKSLDRATAAVRQTEANEGADITETRDAQAELRGRLEVLQKDIDDIRKAVDKVDARVSFAEKYLDIGEKSLKKASPEVAPGKNSDVQGPTDSEAAYAMAFSRFRDEKYALARSEFESFLARYPDAGKAADAA